MQRHGGPAELMYETEQERILRQYHEWNASNPYDDIKPIDPNVDQAGIGAPEGGGTGPGPGGGGGEDRFTTCLIMLVLGFEATGYLFTTFIFWGMLDFLY